MYILLVIFLVGSQKILDNPLPFLESGMRTEGGWLQHYAMVWRRKKARAEAAGLRGSPTLFAGTMIHHSGAKKLSFQKELILYAIIMRGQGAIGMLIGWHKPNIGRKAYQVCRVGA